MGYFWIRKIGIIVAGLCVAGIIHRLLTTLMCRNEDFSRSAASINVEASSTSRKKIIVLSYMRSGSTLTADIIQSHPDVFYVYEPLMYLWDYFVPNKMAATQDLRRRTKAFWKMRHAKAAPPLDFMTSMFNCNLSATNLEFLTNVGHSLDFEAAGCPLHRNGMNLVNTASISCIRTVTTRCSQAKAVLLKVVRLSMEEADVYLQANPDVRIIHLVRDPRGILLSRMEFNDKDTGEMHNNYSNICRRIHNDVRASQLLSHRHPGKVLTMRYEDLVHDMETHARAVFKFLDMRLHSNVLAHLQEISSTQDLLPNNKVKAKKTRRKDPYGTAYRWRSALPFSVVKKVDAACAELYTIMGYRVFHREADLRNKNLPARSKYYGKDLMTALV